jgi:hypothetical protein
MVWKQSVISENTLLIYSTYMFCLKTYWFHVFFRTSPLAVNYLAIVLISTTNL